MSAVARGGGARRWRTCWRSWRAGADRRPAISDTRSSTARPRLVRGGWEHRSMSDADVRIPRAMRAAAQPIVEVTDDVCRLHLDEEYAQIARRLVARLARKRPSPLVRGDARIWAGGVLYVA